MLYLVQYYLRFLLTAPGNPPCGVGYIRMAATGKAAQFFFKKN